jgi:hypothetical protein
MDLALFGRVIWRFKYVAIGGLLLASALAFLSFVRVDPSGSNHLSYREKQQWASYATLLVTQKGFTEGTIDPTDSQDGSPNAGTIDSARSSALALIYSKLILGDPVRKMMLQQGPINGTIDAAPVTATSDSTDALPMISIAAISDTPKDSTALVGLAMNSFLTYFKDQQATNAIPDANRVELEVLNQPGRETLLKDRSKTLPIVVFLTVVLATIALCFVLDNLRPRRQKPMPVNYRSDRASERERRDRSA